MSRIITKFSVVALIAAFLFFFIFSSVYRRSPYLTSLGPDSLDGAKLKDESLEGSAQQKEATALPPTYVVSEKVKNGGEPTVSEEEKKRLEEEKRLEDKKRLEKEKRLQDEEKKQQEQNEQERKDKEADEKAMVEHKKIKIHPGTFDAPKDLFHDPAGPKSNEIVLLAASNDNGSCGIENILSDMTTNRQEFASLHGYVYQFLNISKYDIGSAHAVWGKLPAIVETFNLHPQAKWVWWLDVDAILMTPQIDLAKHILSHEALSKKTLKNMDLVKSNRPTGIRTTANPDFNNIDLILAQDMNGLNAGSFWIRRSEFSKLFIDMWSDPMFVREKWWGREQEAMAHLIKEHPTFLEHVALVKQNEINAYPLKNVEYIAEINAYPLKNVEHMRWREGDLVVHLAGCCADGVFMCEAQWAEYMAMRTPVASLPIATAAATAAATHE